MKTVHVALDEHGLEGQWVDLRDPRFLSKRTIDRWQREIEAATLTAESFLREFVAAWHLLDADTGEEMNNPATDSIDGAPLVVFQVLNARAGELFRAPLAAQGSGGPDRSMADGDTGSIPAADRV